jgi:succinate dehydrogenase / fumarate reductase flavoprotein subunit
VSVHGANRLGTNSLVDLVVFGRRAGKHIAEFVKHADSGRMPSDAAEPARASLARLRDGRKAPLSVRVRDDMELVMMEKVGIYRNEAELAEAVTSLTDLRGRWTELRGRDPAGGYNGDLLGVLELQNLLDLALLTASAARARTESRGAHARDDHPDRNDARWLRHSLAWLEKDAVRLGERPVDITTWKPKPRAY